VALAAKISLLRDRSRGAAGGAVQALSAAGVDRYPFPSSTTHLDFLSEVL
jgi:hypothetical protein